MVHHRLPTGRLARSFNDYKPLRIQCTLKAKQPNSGAVIIFFLTIEQHTGSQVSSASLIVALLSLSSLFTAATMLAGTWLPMKSLSRTLDPSTRIGRVGRLALRHSLFSRLQAGTIVSVARMTMERKPRVLAKVLYPPLNQPTANQKLQYLSFYFRVDDRRPDTAYTFTVPKGQDLMEALMSYASRMACHSSDEYVGAFQRHVKKLHAGEIPLPPLIQAQKSARDNATQDLKAPVPEILLPGKARDEEIERRLRQGQSFIDMGSSFQRTTMFIAREANRILGKYEVETLLRQKKRGQWSNDETQRLIALREQGLPLKTLTVWLRRTRPSIQKKLEELRSTLSGPGAVEGPQELPRFGKHF
jgi:hypothetical protein